MLPVSAQHDRWCAAGAAPDDGDLQQHHALRAGLQHQLSKIIEPIQSRCAIVRFTKLGEKDVLERLLHVCQHEKVRSADLRSTL